MAAAIAGIKLTLEDGTDLTEKVDPRFVSLSLSEKRDGAADALSITLQNTDGKLAVPSSGMILRLALGWISGDDVRVGLVDKGRFKVDTVSERGPPDSVTIRASSADLTGSYTKRRSRVWDGTTLGAMVSAIAKRHGATASVHPDLANEPIEAIEQHNKSDMAMVQDLGRRFDALATWKDGRIIIMPKGSATNVSGQTMPIRTIAKTDGWIWEFTRAERDAQNGVEAQYHDAASGTRKTISIGSTNLHRLKHIYASKSSATRAAKSNAAKRGRERHHFTYDLARADCTMLPNQSVKLSGWSATITATQWLIDSIETTMGAGGLRQKVEFEGV